MNRLFQQPAWVHTALGIGAIVCVAAGAAWLRLAQSPSSTQPEAPPASPPSAQERPSSPSTARFPSSSSPQSSVVTVVVEGRSFSFSPSTIEVPYGATVQLVFRNMEGIHNLVLDAFGVRTAVLAPHQEDTITFKATQPGSFEFYCSVGNHRALGMRGTLVVRHPSR